MASQLETYLEKSGQDFSDLMEGAATYGPEYIEKELIPKALEQNKKIVWVPRLVDGEDLGLMDWELQDL